MGQMPWYKASLCCTLFLHSNCMIQLIYLTKAFWTMCDRLILFVQLVKASTVVKECKWEKLEVIACPQMSMVLHQPCLLTHLLSLLKARLYKFNIRKNKTYSFVKANIVPEGRKWLRRIAIEPVLVKTTIEVPRLLDIIVAWNANISLIWFCSEWKKPNQLGPN